MEGVFECLNNNNPGCFGQFGLVCFFQHQSKQPFQVQFEAVKIGPVFWFWANILRAKIFLFRSWNLKIGLISFTFKRILILQGHVLDQNLCSPFLNQTFAHQVLPYFYLKLDVALLSQACILLFTALLIFISLGIYTNVPIFLKWIQKHASGGSCGK